VSGRTSYGYGPGELPPGTPPGVILGVLGGDGIDGMSLSRHLTEKDRWQAELQRRALVRGITRTTPQADLQLSMGDDEWAKWKAERP
jgi:hypothetical protein